MKPNRITLVMTGAAVVLCAGCTGSPAAGPGGPQLPTFSASPSASPPGTASGTISVPEIPPAGATGQPAPAEPPPAEPPQAATPEECRSGELRLSIGQGNGAAGTVYRPLRFTNVGGRTCVIQGFPGVSYVAGDDGHQVGSAAFRVGTKGSAVSLAPGATANAPVGFTQVGNFDPGACRPTGVRGLRVYPPHETASLFLPMDGTGCAGNPPGNQLVVKTMENGAGA